MTRSAAASMVLLALMTPAWADEPLPLPPPRTIDQLRHAEFEPMLSVGRELRPGRGLRAYLASYSSAGLKVHALVAVPETPRPSAGYPVLIANHGFHPDPPRYGITATGIDWRPGDYYREVPAVFTRIGFMVVMPDYRGHNDSEGFEFTQSPLATRYYTQDVLALLAGLSALPDADTDRVFMWGHSMGGDVSLRALLATDRIRGASLWAPAAAPRRELAAQLAETGLSPSEPPVGATGAHDADELMRHLHTLATPLLIQHARDDRTVPYRWSQRLADSLNRHQKRYTLHGYDSDQHMFEGELLRTAVARDSAFFRSLMQAGER